MFFDELDDISADLLKSDFILEEGYSVIIESDEAFNRLLIAQSKDEYRIIKESESGSYDEFSFLMEGDEEKKEDDKKEKADKSLWEKFKYWIKKFWVGVKKYWRHVIGFFGKLWAKLKRIYKGFSYNKDFVNKVTGVDYSDLPKQIYQISKKAHDLLDKVAHDIPVSEDSIKEIKEYKFEFKEVKEVTYKIANPTYFIDGKAQEIIEGVTKVLEEAQQKSEKMTEGDVAATKAVLNSIHTIAANASTQVKNAVTQATAWVKAGGKDSKKDDDEKKNESFDFLDSDFSTDWFSI